MSIICLIKLREEEEEEKSVMRKTLTNEQHKNKLFSINACLS